MLNHPLYNRAAWQVSNAVYVRTLLCIIRIRMINVINDCNQLYWNVTKQLIINKLYMEIYT